MAKKQLTMRLSSLKAGEYYYIENPARIVRIVGDDVIEQRDPNNPRAIQTIPAVSCEGTIPDFVIPGIIDRRRAAQNHLIKVQVAGETLSQDFQEDVWTEIWAERYVPVPFKNEIGAAVVSEFNDPHQKRQRMQIYVASEGGRPHSSQSSPLSFKEVVAHKIDAAIIPENAFLSGDAAEEYEEALAAAVEAREEAKPKPKPRKLGKKANAAAARRIQERALAT